MFLNDYDVEDVERAAAHDFHRPNLTRLALTVARLRDWTNRNSDGWVYWTKPQNAAKKATALLYTYYLGRYDERPEGDITPAQVKAAEATIRAFLTRQGVEHGEVFPNG